MTRRRRLQSLIPLSHQHRDALMVAFRLHHPAPPAPVTPMTPASTPQSRAADALAFFGDHLVGHFRAEEQVLFPLLRARLAGDPPRLALIDRLIAEHRRLEALRDGVAAAGDDTIGAALGAFADLLESHVRAEERELFETVPDVLQPGDAEGLEAAIRAALGARPAA